MTKKENSFVRFGLRSLMALTALTSIILATTIPHIRSQPAERQGPLYWTLAIVGVLGTVMLLGLCLYRLWIERRSGALVFHPKQSLAARWVFACLMLPLFTGLLFIDSKFAIEMLQMSSKFSEESDLRMHFNLYSVLILVLPIAMLIVATVLPFWGLGITSLEVREKGIIVGGIKFHPWTSGVRLTCQPAKKPDRTVVTITHRKKSKIIVIQSDDREVLEQHLLTLEMRPN